MTKKAAETASFMVRFNQKIYEDKGESKVQWRGKVSHVQGGEDMSFSDFNDAVTFIQERLAELTMEATKDKTNAEQEGILHKSFSLFKSVAATGNKVLMDTIKDPKKQVAHFQDQLSDLGEEMWEKVPIDQWRTASKSDFQDIKQSISALTKSVAMLTKKVDALSTEIATVTTPVKKAAVKKPAAKKPASGVKKTTTKAKTTKSTKK
jgi:septal ring factor EnvC (AmiA/AmiB activator)